MVSFLKRGLLSILLSTEIWLNRQKPLKVQHTCMRSILMRVTFLKFLMHHYWCVYSGSSGGGGPITTLLKGGRIRPYDVYNEKIMLCYYKATLAVLINMSKRHSIVSVVNCSPDQIVIVPNGKGGFLYPVNDTNGRPHQIWYRPISSVDKEDKLIYQIADSITSRPATLKVSLSRDQQHIIITSSTRLTSEVYTIPVSSPDTASPVLVYPFTDGIQYFIDHAHDGWYMVTNKDSDRYKLFYCSDDDFHLRKWTQVAASLDNNVILQDVEFFKDYLILYGNTTSVKPVIQVIKPTNSITSQVSHTLVKSLELDNHTLVKPCHNCFNSSNIKVILSSSVSQQTLHHISCDDTCKIRDYGDRTLSPANGKSDYCITRISAINKDDGINIPITLVHRKGVQKDITNPLLTICYGSHGIPVSMGYRESVVSLLKRDWTIAYCHVRGGNELGPKWFHEATGIDKAVTHKDLYWCLMCLHESGYSSPVCTAVMGRSSGGMAVGNLCNHWPHLLQAAILDMPHVNISHSLLRSNGLSLTDYLDREEFIPKNNSSYFKDEKQIIRSICPYYNLKPKDYPSFLVLASDSDELIDIEGTDGYVSQLKNCIHQYQSTSPHAGNGPTLHRGTVQYERLRGISHYEGAFNQSFRRKQELCKVIFLLQAISGH